MSFLSRLELFEVRGERLVMHAKPVALVEQRDQKSRRDKNEKRSEGDFEFSPRHFVRELCAVRRREHARGREQ